jgi:hypothetical protein
MCQVYRETGALQDLVADLESLRIDDLRTLDDISAFLRNYPDRRREMMEAATQKAKQEKIDLQAELAALNALIAQRKAEKAAALEAEMAVLNMQLSAARNADNRDFWTRIRMLWKAWFISRKLKQMQAGFDAKLNEAVAHLTAELDTKSGQLQFIEEKFDQAVISAAGLPFLEMERRKSALDLSSLKYYGAIGEDRVARSLAALPEPSFLINNFCLNFSKPLYYREEDSHIRSIQIDHLLITAAGLFIIETKNWSAESMANLSLRSPVQQIRRSGYALYRLLRSTDTARAMGLSGHHWGEIQLPVRNLLVFINQKPSVSFPYVKVLTVQELNGYIQYFKPVFSASDTQRIGEYMLKICDRRV